MKGFARWFFALALVFAASGCLSPDRPSAMGSTVGWKKYTSRSGSFAVVAPSLASESRDFWTLDAKPVNSRTWTFTQGGGSMFRVTYFRIAKPMDKREQEHIVHQMKLSSPQMKVWLLDSHPIEVDDGSGREFDLYWGSGPGRARGKGRLLFYGVNVYFIYGAIPGLQADDGRIQMFFDTFMHLGDPGVDIQKGDAA